MSDITIQKGGTATISATVPAGRTPAIRLAVYGPANKLGGFTYSVPSKVAKPDGSTDVILVLRVPDLWFSGNAAKAFIDCGQCGYGVGRYVVSVIESGKSPFELEIASGSVAVEGPPPSKDLLEQECPDCADDPPTTPGTPPTTKNTNDPLIPTPTPPTGDPCLPPNFVMPEPPVPTPCSP